MKYKLIRLIITLAVVVIMAVVVGLTNMGIQKLLETPEVVAAKRAK